MANPPQQAQLNVNLSPKQSEFFTSQAKYPAYGGGWGNGKTMVGCLKSYMTCHNYPGARFLIGRKNYTDLRDSTINDFLEIFGEKSPYGTFYGGDSKKFVLPNGSEILFKHLDNLQSLTNLNLSGGWIDQAEEIAEDSFLFLRGRMRRKGVPVRQVFVTFNMEGHNWIWKYWKAKDPKKVGDQASEYHLVEASTLSNQANLPPDYLAQLESLPPELYRRYVEGSWEVFEGQIYTEFDKSVHVIEPFTIPEDWLMFEALDVGVRHPTGYLQGFEAPDGTLYIVKEFREQNLTATQIASKIIYMRQGRTPVLSVIDPSSGKTEQTSGENLKRQLAEEGFYAQNANNDVMAGINRVKQMLLSGKLKIFSSCRMLIEEVEQYQWQKPRINSGVTYHAEKPLKINDDLCDPLRYMTMSRPDRFSFESKQAEKAFMTFDDLEDNMTLEQAKEAAKYFI